MKQKIIKAQSTVAYCRKEIIVNNHANEQNNEHTNGCVNEHINECADEHDPK